VTVYRFRQCPACGVILPAGQFGPMRLGAAWHTGGHWPRACPECGHWGETRDFPIKEGIDPSGYELAVHGSECYPPVDPDTDPPLDPPAVSVAEQLDRILGRVREQAKPVDTARCPWHDAHRHSNG
jgi:hypothetical protein